ncbi:MAG: methyltransferase domain-containing protein [Pseudomonadota bacterium]
MTDSEKPVDFEPIENEYTFYLANTDETERQLAAFGRHLDGIALPADRPLRFLDFGCSTGAFTGHFLTRAGWPPDRLEIALVEPVEDQRRRAAAALASFTTRPIAHWPALPDDQVAGFDLMVSNFVIPYVRDLMATLGQLLAARAPGGLLLAANAGTKNALYGLVELGFRSIGQQVPYHLTEQMAAALDQLGAPYEIEPVPHRVSFPDSEANRLKLIRFLMTDTFAQIDPAPLVRFFDRFAENGRIEIDTVCEHFVIRADG